MSLWWLIENRKLERISLFGPTLDFTGLAKCSADQISSVRSFFIQFWINQFQRWACLIHLHKDLLYLSHDGHCKMIIGIATMKTNQKSPRKNNWSAVMMQERNVGIGCDKRCAERKDLCNEIEPQSCQIRYFCRIEWNRQFWKCDEWLPRWLTSSTYADDVLIEGAVSQREVLLHESNAILCHRRGSYLRNLDISSFAVGTKITLMLSPYLWLVLIPIPISMR